MSQLDVNGNYVPRTITQIKTEGDLLIATTTPIEKGGDLGQLTNAIYTGIYNFDTELSLLNDNVSKMITYQGLQIKRSEIGDYDAIIITVKKNSNFVDCLPVLGSDDDTGDKVAGTIRIYVQTASTIANTDYQEVSDELALKTLPMAVFTQVDDNCETTTITSFISAVSSKDINFNEAVLIDTNVEVAIVKSASFSEELDREEVIGQITAMFNETQLIGVAFNEQYYIAGIFKQGFYKSVSIVIKDTADPPVEITTFNVYNKLILSSVTVTYS